MLKKFVLKIFRVKKWCQKYVFLHFLTRNFLIIQKFFFDFWEFILCFPGPFRSQISILNTRDNFYLSYNRSMRAGRVTYYIAYILKNIFTRRPRPLG